MKQAFFLTGTDTEIGKTFITCALLAAARQHGLSTAGVKPVAAGTDPAGRNEDVDHIRSASSVILPERILNPYCFQSPIAPHIAAAEEAIDIDFDVIAAACKQARQSADFVIVEGVGGFCVPLGVDRDSANLAVSLGLPIILVVGMRLGCINHALLTLEAVQSRGLTVAGWVANRIDPQMSRFEENLRALQARIPAPLLGTVPYLAEGGYPSAAGYLTLP